jgi:hypothetical protein
MGQESTKRLAEFRDRLEHDIADAKQQLENLESAQSGSIETGKDRSQDVIHLSIERQKRMISTIERMVADIDSELKTRE